MSVVVIGDSGTKVLFTIVIEAFEENRKLMYFGLDKKVSDPSAPPSILDKQETPMSPADLADDADETQNSTNYKMSFSAK
mgnify:CR=1 FL=1